MAFDLFNPPPAKTAEQTGSTKGPHALRTIGEVADQLGVATHVVRFWEGKFSHLIKPVRRANRRYYRPDDVATLQQIQHLTRVEGLTLEGAAQRLNPRTRKHSAPSAASGSSTLSASQKADLLADLAHAQRLLA